MNRFSSFGRGRNFLFLMPVLVFLFAGSLPAAEPDAPGPSPLASALAQAAENAESFLPAAKEWLSGANLPLFFALLAVVPGVPEFRFSSAPRSGQSE